MSQQVKSSSVTVRQNLLSSERRIALIVGVDDAPNSDHPKLRHAVADANAMAEVLEQQCNFELLEKPLVNEYATSANIKRAILDLKRNRNDKDFLLFYFSGHGFPWSLEVGGDDVYLVTHDFSQEEVSEDSSFHISFKWLREKLYVENKAQKVVLILDCCYAGNMSLSAPDHYLEEIQQRLNYYFDAPGANSGAKIGGLRQTLAATCHNATALERNGHGLMTNWLLSALEGKADDALDSEGQVTLFTLRSFLQSNMPTDRPPSLSGGDAGHYCVLAYFPDRHRKLVISQHLTTGMTVLPTDYASRIQNFFTEYLGTSQSPVPFGGRESDLAYLHAWLDDPKVPPYLLLAAPAGRGKSALLVRWSKELVSKTDLAVVFLPVSIRFRTNLAGVVFTSLTARLAFLHGEKIPATLDTSLEVWRGLMTDYLARPLPDGKRLILILDGVDEAADWEASPDLFPLAPPKDLRIIISARYLAGHSDARPWLRRIGWNHANLAHTLVLNPLTFDGVADVLMRMGFPLSQC